MFTDPQFWVAVAFFIFVAVIFNPVRKMLTSNLDKQIKQIKEWEVDHPNWNTNDEETEMYAKMVQHVMGGGNDIDVEKNKESNKTNKSKN